MCEKGPLHKSLQNKLNEKVTEVENQKKGTR